MPGLLAVSLTVASLAAAAPSRAEEAPVGDPMRPFEPGVAGDPRAETSRAYVLTAVLISPSRRVAVINGQLHREGDEIDGARLRRIEARSVRLMRDGEELVVPLSSGSRPASTNDGETNP